MLPKSQCAIVHKYIKYRNFPEFVVLYAIKSNQTFWLTQFNLTHSFFGLCLGNVASDRVVRDIERMEEGRIARVITTQHVEPVLLSPDNGDFRYHQAVDVPSNTPRSLS